MTSNPDGKFSRYPERQLNTTHDDHNNTMKKTKYVI